jgi:RNA polymerase sigma factor (sigma-70 family)
MNNPLPTPSAIPLETDAFRNLYQEYQSFVYRRAYSMLGDRVAAEDVTQNTFIQVYRNLHQYRGGAMRVWLFRIVTNACYDELRRRKRNARLRPVSIDALSGDYNQLENLAATDLTAEDTLEQLELSTTIQRCLDIMPQTNRAPLVLVDILEMDYSEAAKVLAIPIGTLKSRLWRARSQLRTLLEYNTDFMNGSYAHHQRISA